MFLLTFICYVALGISLQNGIISFSILFFSYFLYYIPNPQRISFTKVGLLDLVIVNFLFWNIFSIFDVIYFNKSILIYVKGVSYCLFPIFAFFSFSHSQHKVNFEVVHKYLKYIVITTLFTVSIGIYFYLFSPAYYVNYVIGKYEGLITDSDSIFMARLLSYFGDPTVMGNISVISLPILVYIIRQKKAPFTSKLFNALCFIILISGVLLSFARSAWVACVLYLFYLIVIDNKYFLVRIFSIIMMVVVAVGLIFVANMNFDNPILEALQKRIFSMGGSFEERNSQIEYAVSLITSSPLGIGLGQAGHKSVSGSVNLGVFDNNYLRIFAETGIIGFVSFLMIIGLSLYLGLRRSNDQKINHIRILVLIVLSVFYFQSIGSNILDLHYSSFLFWSFLGILAWTYKFKGNF